MSLSPSVQIQGAEKRVMVESTEATPSSSQNFNLHVIRSRINELEELQKCLDEDDASSSLTSLGSERLLKDCALNLERILQQIVSECFDVNSFLGIEDLDAYTEEMKEELMRVEAESNRIFNEIEVLKKVQTEDSNRLKTDLELLKCSLDNFISQDVDGDNEMKIMDEHGSYGFEELELESQIEENKRILKSFEELDDICKSFDVTEQIEDTFGGLKVIDVSKNFIKLSLQTHIPNLEDLPSSVHRIEGIIEPSELNHELLIEVLEGTRELKNVEIFPSDVHLRDIIDASKSMGNSSLRWFVRKVQDKIVLCALRQFLVKSANKSRYSFQYLDEDETIICNMIGGVDALIKVSQGWPLSKSPFNLTSLKSSDHCMKGISLSLICKVEKMANSLEVQIRQNLTSFAEAIEKILKEQMHLQLQSDADADADANANANATLSL